MWPPPHVPLIKAGQRGQRGRREQQSGCAPSGGWNGWPLARAAVSEVMPLAPTQRAEIGGPSRWGVQLE